MARTLANLEAIEPGFEPDGLVAMHVDLPSDRYPGGAARAAFFDALLERLHSVAGVTGAAIADGHAAAARRLLGRAPDVEGGRRRPAADDDRAGQHRLARTTSGRCGIPLLAGRDFDRGRHVRARSSSAADWPIGSGPARTPSAGAFRLSSTWPWRTVVGVAGNVETRGAGEVRTALQTVLPVRDAARGAGRRADSRSATPHLRLARVVVRADNPSAAIPEIKRQIWAIDARQPVERVSLVSDLYAEAFGRQRFVLTLMSAFSFIALALTVAGIFGVLSQIVVRRTREIGIRVVLGAQPRDVMGQVLRSGLMLSLAGAAIGIGAALSLARVLRTLLFGVTPYDPVSFAAVGVFLVAVALLACWLPARAAMRIEPAAALRVE